MSIQVQEMSSTLGQVKLILRQQPSLGFCRRLAPSSRKVTELSMVDVFFVCYALMSSRIFVLASNGIISLYVSGFEAFREILDRKASAHPFENVQSLLPPNSWLGLYPVPGKFYF